MPSSCLPFHAAAGRRTRDEGRPHQAQPVKDLAQVAREAILDSLAPVWLRGNQGRWPLGLSRGGGSIFS